jgi:hypothetical protein
VQAVRKETMKSFFHPFATWSGLTE